MRPGICYRPPLLHSREWQGRTPPGLWARRSARTSLTAKDYPRSTPENTLLTNMQWSISRPKDTRNKLNASGVAGVTSYVKNYLRNPRPICSPVPRRGLSLVLHLETSSYPTTRSTSQLRRRDSKIKRILKEKEISRTRQKPWLQLLSRMEAKVKAPKIKFDSNPSKISPKTPYPQDQAKRSPQDHPRR